MLECGVGRLPGNHAFLLDESLANEPRKRTGYGLGNDFIGTLAFFAFFQLGAFGAEPIQGRISGAADLVEILNRPVFAVHTEMPECAVSFFAVSGLRGHLTFTFSFKSMLTPKIGTGVQIYSQHFA